ncbi:hypothetical protein M408DRAFT_327853 [Serendipita vermifera MAFF 305830]|uniref:Uncharacterized protein n=1 Tax=Serendipita vermifera MAFF 305830 TaxID=933852 RepID=A0A0C3BFJ5_SERVB|nr:hypothetical protein M408DRAFT_327853 [Serendipita vermifera MAFF 305830]
MKLSTILVSLLSLTTLALSAPVPAGPAKAASVSTKVVAAVQPAVSKPRQVTTAVQSSSKSKSDKVVNTKAIKLNTKAIKLASTKKGALVQKKPSDINDPFPNLEKYSKQFGGNFAAAMDAKGEGKKAKYLQNQAAKEAKAAKTMLQQAKKAKYATIEDREAAIQKVRDMAARARKDRTEGTLLWKDAQQKEKKIRTQVTDGIRKQFIKTYAAVVKQNKQVDQLDKELGTY